MADHSFYHRGGDTGFLLVHGLGGTPAELRYLAIGLSRKGHTVSCCQLAGHCGSEAELVATRWQDWSSSVATAYRALRGQCRTVIVGGLSMGALLALNLAADEDHGPDGLALYAPTLWYDGWAVPWYSFLVRVLKETPLRHIAYSTEREPYGIKNERLRRIIMSQMLSGDTSAAGCLRTPGEALRQFVRLVDHVKPRLDTIDIPALIVHPRDDDMASVSNAIYLQRKLGGIVDCVILNDSYHMVTIDQQRDVVVEKTLGFAAWLAGHVGDRARKPGRRPQLDHDSVSAGTVAGVA